MHRHHSIDPRTAWTASSPALRIGRCLGIALVSAASSMACAQTPASSAALAPYIAEDSPRLAITHVLLFDGTGAPPRPDQTIVIDHGKILDVGDAGQVHLLIGVKVLDMRGHTALPGLIGMHEHLFYDTVAAGGRRLNLYTEMADSNPRLYLACGITTARTAGSIEPYTDLALKQAIDAGAIPGPHLDVTGPYLEGKPSFSVQMYPLKDAQDARETVNYWADRGVTSFKAYIHITPAELQAAIVAAHAHGLKITGHLCSVGFREAVAMGIDNLEHGWMLDSEFYPGKQPGICPGQSATVTDLAARVDPASPEVRALIQDLVTHHVTITSTLDVLEAFVPNRPPMETLERTRRVLAEPAWNDFLTTRATIAESSGDPAQLAPLKKEMEFEREFVAAGGLLMAGSDPNGYGGLVAGFADQREFELLIEAGFSTSQAVEIYTRNAAHFLGKEREIGTIAAGQNADIVLLKGDLSRNPRVIENTTIVFKDGVGFDSAKLIGSVSGIVGFR